MWLESEAVVSTMVQLMQIQDAPSLPVHDSLLVPVSHEEWAKVYLTTSYRYHCKVTPYLQVHPPNNSNASTLVAR
jgi:hypothetical protein